MYINIFFYCRIFFSYNTARGVVLWLLNTKRFFKLCYEAILFVTRSMIVQDKPTKIYRYFGCYVRIAGWKALCFFCWCRPSSQLLLLEYSNQVFHCIIFIGDTITYIFMHKDSNLKSLVPILRYYNCHYLLIFKFNLIKTFDNFDKT